MEGTIGEIRLFGGNFAPQNWAFCEGQLLPIASNPALFSIIGAMYGGDGRTTMALPNLKGRTAIHAGQGGGLSNRILGQSSGVETVTLSIQNLAQHSHAAMPTTFKPLGIDEKDNSPSPEGNHPSKTTDAGNPIYHAQTNVTMAEQNVSLSTGNTGGNQPVDNVQPTLALRYIICLQGLFPQRD